MEKIIKKGDVFLFTGAEYSDYHIIGYFEALVDFDILSYFEPKDLHNDRMSEHIVGRTIDGMIRDGIIRKHSIREVWISNYDYSNGGEKYCHEDRIL